MKKQQNWIFSVRYQKRFAVVGPARVSTVEAALHLAAVPEETRAKIRAHAVVRDFVEGRLDPEEHGYYASYYSNDCTSSEIGWSLCIGSVQEVLGR